MISFSFLHRYTGDRSHFLYFLDDVPRGVACTVAGTREVCAAGEVVVRLSSTALSVWTSPVGGHPATGAMLAPLPGGGGAFLDLTAMRTVRSDAAAGDSPVRKLGWIRRDLATWKGGEIMFRPLFGFSASVAISLVRGGPNAAPTPPPLVPAYLCRACGGQARKVCSRCQDVFYCGDACRGAAPCCTGPSALSFDVKLQQLEGLVKDKLADLDTLVFCAGSVADELDALAAQEAPDMRMIVDRLAEAAKTLRLLA